MYGAYISIASRVYLQNLIYLKLVLNKRRKVFSATPLQNI